MARTTLVLIRHAASAGPAPDAELTPLGVAQANALAERLNELGVDAAYSSPYRRARATISPFALSVGLPVKVLNDLHERVLSPAPMADWQEHIERSFGDFDYKLPGGESLRDAYQRGLNALQQVAGAGHALPAATSHGNLIASILHSVDPAFGFSSWRQMRNPDVFELVLDMHAPVAYRRIDYPAVNRRF